MAIEFVSASPTISAAAIYASGDAVGGLITVGKPSQPVLQSIVLVDDDKENATTDLILFRRSVTVAADNAAFTLQNTDDDAVIGYVTFDTYKDFGSHSVAQVTNLALLIPAGDSLYGQLVTRGTPTYTNTDDIRLNFIFAPY